MKVIVGSAGLWPTPQVASAVLAIMASFDDSFGVRCDRLRRVASGTEDLVIKIGERIPRIVSMWEPSSAGSSSAFTRDNRMVAASSGVYAFFAPGQEMAGGTGHVVAVALRTGTPVEAYCLDNDGMVAEIGSDAGDLLPLYNGR